MCNEKERKSGREGRGVGAEIKWKSVCVHVCVCCRIAGHSTAPKGESQYEGGRHGEGGNKAKVYESKGTPNYSYTIHD